MTTSAAIASSILLYSDIACMPGLFHECVIQDDIIMKAFIKFICLSLGRKPLYISIRQWTIDLSPVVGQAFSCSLARPGLKHEMKNIGPKVNTKNQSLPLGSSKSMQ